MKYLITAHRTYNRDHQRYDARQHRAVKYILSHLVQIICTKKLCNRNTKSCATAHTESQNQKLYTAACSNSRQSLISQYLPHNSRIYYVVRLLEQIAEQERGGKLQHQTEGLTGNHGLSHVLHLPYIIDMTVSCQFFFEHRVAIHIIRWVASAYFALQRY